MSYNIGNKHAEWLTKDEAVSIMDRALAMVKSGEIQYKTDLSYAFGKERGTIEYRLKKYDLLKYVNKEIEKVKPNRPAIYKNIWNKYTPDLNEKIKAKYKKNPTFRLRVCFAAQLNYHLRNRNISSLNKKYDVLGYSIQDLINHLESNFNDGMSWENYGSYWHVDHIKPASLFNYKSSDCDEFKECWSLNNLQPLEAKKNLSKGNRYIG